MLKRNQNWPIALNEVIRNRAATPFQYGSHDCAQFTADCINAMTGTDLMADFRGRYATQEGALKVLDECFGGDLEEAMERIADQYELEEIVTLRAKGGDIVLRDSDQGPALGIISGRFCCFAAPPRVIDAEDIRVPKSMEHLKCRMSSPVP